MKSIRNSSVVAVVTSVAVLLGGCSQPSESAGSSLTPSAPAASVLGTQIPPLATIGGVRIDGSGFGSSWTPVPGTTDQFYGLTDRGPNVDGPDDNQKVEPLPDFAPKIGKFKVSGSHVDLLRTITMTAPDGKPFNGLVPPQASTGETIVDLTGKTLPPSDHGLDSEGLVALPDGTFWVSDEYGPYVLHLDASGKEIERLAPGHGLPDELRLRTPNQGMEGLTITPDGRTLVGIMQSALKTPGLKGDAKKVPLTRIVTVDLATRQTHEFAYVLDDPAKTKKAVSEIAAVGANQFLVVERDGKFAPGADKTVYRIDTSKATDIESGDHSEIGGHDLETAVGTTDSRAAQSMLKSAGITPVSKQPFVDLGAAVDRMDRGGKVFGHDKIEGLATTDGGKTLYLSNDSDFGLAGVSNKTPPYILKPKTLPSGRQDTGEILVVHTAGGR